MGLSGGIQIHLSSQMWGIYSSEGEGGGLWLLDISYWCHFISSMSLTIITNCSPLPTSNVPLLRKFYKEHSGLTWILLWQLCKISLIISSVPHIKLLYTRICVPYKIWAETVGVLWYLPPIVGWLRGGGLSHWAFEFFGLSYVDATIGISIEIEYSPPLFSWNSEMNVPPPFLKCFLPPMYTYIVYREYFIRNDQVEPEFSL